MIKKLFMPLEKDKTTWDLSNPLFFINGALERELTKEEHDNVTIYRLDYYETIKFEYISKKVKPFVDKLIRTIGNRLGEYHKVGYSLEYWIKFLYVWVLNYCITGYYVIELFEQIKKQTNGYVIETAIYQRSPKARCFIKDFFQTPWYYDWMTSVGEKILDLKVSYYSKKNYTRTFDRRKIVCNYKEKQNRFFGKIKNLSIKKVKYKIYSKRPKKDVSVLYGTSYFDSNDLQQMIVDSRGKIQPAKFYYEGKCKEVDCSYRQLLRRQLINEISVDESWMEIICDIISDDLPAIYIEQYKEYHEAAMSFLGEYPKLKVIKVTTDMLDINPTMFLGHLAREVNKVTIVGSQHGGNYGIQKGCLSWEKYVDDIFYGWGSWANKKVPLSVVKQGPSDKLYRYVSTERKDGYFFYVGTVLPVDIKFYINQARIFDCDRYISWQIEFFENLDFANRRNLLLKNYPIEYGWRINDIVKKKFPDVRIVGDHEWENWDMVDVAIREKEFGRLLGGCKLFVCDHLSTSWLEALKSGKPILMVFPEDYYVYEETENPFIHMMEDAEIIVHSPKKAAEIINKMSNDDSWWNNPERQKVVEAIKDRYMGTQTNAVEWWTRELLNIAKEV